MQICLLVVLLLAMAIRRVVDHVMQVCGWLWTLLQRHDEEVRSGDEVDRSSCFLEGAARDAVKECRFEASVETSWRDLVEHPENWWDNRSTRRNPKAPDFKHRATRQALWIDNSRTPMWARRHFEGVF